MAKKFKSLLDRLIEMKTRPKKLNGKQLQTPKQKVYIVLGFGPGDVTHIIKVHSNHSIATFHAHGLNCSAPEGVSYGVIKKSVEGKRIKSW